MEIEKSERGGGRGEEEEDEEEEERSDCPEPSEAGRSRDPRCSAPLQQSGKRITRSRAIRGEGADGERERERFSMNVTYGTTQSSKSTQKERLAWSAHENIKIREKGETRRGKSKHMIRCTCNKTAYCAG